MWDHAPWRLLVRRLGRASPVLDRIPRCMLCYHVYFQGATGHGESEEKGVVPFQRESPLSRYVPQRS